MDITTHPPGDPDPDFDLELVRGAVKEATKERAGRIDAPRIPLDDIYVIPGFNPRIDTPKHLERVREIADSIKAYGFYDDQPLGVFPARMDGRSVLALYSGHTRLAAAKLARDEGTPITSVPVICAPEGTSMEDLTAALQTRNTGAPLAPYELAILCKRMRNYGIEIPEIAQRFNITEKWVHDLLFLASAPKAVRDLVAYDKVTATEAIKNLRKHGANAIQILQGMVDRATAQGKATATGQHAPGARYRSTVRKTATTMADTLRSIRADHGYAALGGELRGKIDDLLQQLDEAQDGAVDADEGDSDAA
ncbi:MAG: ParB N-terminal domain-containing protein [Burkholderiales bacterium]|nr:ParB N-terminal domain-containing protein [Burkholderiales bacterium]